MPKCLYIYYSPTRGTSAIEYGHWEVVVTGDITALAGHHRVCTPPEVCRYISICVSTLYFICNMVRHANM